MPVGKKIMLFHSEQQRKTLGVPSEGFSIPDFGVERRSCSGSIGGSILKEQNSAKSRLSKFETRHTPQTVKF